MIEKLRTPDDLFADLTGFPFRPNYLDDMDGFEGLRAHYLDEGNKDSKEVFLCLHGEPTWSFLYRKMIPIFSQHNIRSVAPDFFGFGRSDKPVNDEVYTFDFHRNFIMKFIQILDLDGITLVCHDWGGLLGLTIPQAMPDRFRRLIVMNTGFGTGRVNEAFLKFREFNRQHPDLQVDKFMAGWTPTMNPSEAMAYAAPFPSQEFKAGVRTFPNLVPTATDMPGVETSRQAIQYWKNEWHGESYMAIGMQDPILGPDVMRPMQKVIQGCPEPFELHEAGHFVPEWGDIVAENALRSFGFVC